MVFPKFAITLFASCSIIAAAMANPMPQAVIQVDDPAIVLPIKTVTVTQTATKTTCPVPSNCIKICATPTVTTEPLCKIFLPCPIAKCIPVSQLTVTATRYCRPGNCNFPTKDCDNIPPETLTPPCPTKCPELCPIPVTTIHIACATIPPRFTDTFLEPADA